MIAVILSGGAGSRLWPVSREMHPKPFLRLNDDQSLLQKTWLRALSLPAIAEMMTVTNRELFFKTEDEYRAIDALISKNLLHHFILEPFGRNTAPAIVAAALQIKKTYHQDKLLLVLPADHLIADLTAFAKVVDQASQLALKGKLVVFGMPARVPETAYGYIEVKDHQVLSFIEKPSLEKAKTFVASGRYLWNSGMFCFTVKTFLNEMREHSPEILEAMQVCIERSRYAEGKNFTQVEFMAETFEQVPDKSIDYALMEKSNNVAIVFCNRMEWNDIGSWKAINEVSSLDEQGNSISGEVLLHDVKNCYIQSHERVIGAIGVNNLVVIDTPDALLVSDRERTQEVKHLYASLKEKGHQAYKLHRSVYRPWGIYTILEEGPGFKIKRIEVKPGASLSLQMHKYRSEHWIVLSGVAKVINGEKELLVHKNQSTYIPSGHKHQLHNPGDQDLIMIEVQSGEYLGEDDIVRFQDCYGRI